MESINPTTEQIVMLKEKLYNTPFVMINLLKFKTNNSLEKSQQLYHQYTRLASPLVDASGGSVMYLGLVRDVFIGRDTDMWDEVLLVYYPSGKAFLQMIAMDEYQKANQLREEALEKCVLLISERII